MRFLVALCFLAAAVQATDIDWANVQPIHIEPEATAGLLDESESRADLGSRIVGGFEATLGQFPYQVAVLSTSARGTGFCGGSILNEDWILTAAHCLDAPISVVVIFAAQTIVDANPEQFRITADSWIIHERWNPSTVKDDVAVIKLSRSLTFSDLVQPTRLPTRSQAARENFAGRTGTVSGWGRDSDSATAISPVLRWTSNPILTNVRCSLWYAGSILANQICLSGNNGRSSCNGDSGGPLVVVDADGAPTQVGIVSHGIAFGCASGWPGVYARTSSYLNWLSEKTGVVIRD